MVAAFGQAQKIITNWRTTMYKVIILRGTGSAVIAINDAGQSVGYSHITNEGGITDPMLWSPSGKATVLQDVGGRGSSNAVAINDAGQSVGSSRGDAVLWSPSGKATVLQDAGGQDNSAAYAINVAGQSVGYSFATPYDYDAVLWSPSGKATNLGTILVARVVESVAVF
jgi:hypothetical protein